MAPSGNHWKSVAPSVTVWHRLAPSGTVRHRLALFGAVWRQTGMRMAQSGTLWHPLEQSGTEGPSLVPSESRLAQSGSSLASVKGPQSGPLDGTL